MSQKEAKARILINDLLKRSGWRVSSMTTGRSPNPIDADLRMHEQLAEAGRILGLRVLDHVIVNRQGHFSFQAAALIQE